MENTHYSKSLALSAFLIAAIPMVAGCDTIKGLGNVFGCVENTNRDPTCIQNLPATFPGLLASLAPAGTSRHVLFITGIAGAARCDNIIFGRDLELGLEPGAADTLRLPTLDDLQNGKAPNATTQIWDWTKDLEGDFCKIFDAPTSDELRSRVFESDKIRAVARTLSEALLTWHQNILRNGRKLTLVCGSGGALVALLATENLPLDEPFFDRVIFISAALSTERSLERLAMLTENGIYNYYSSNDALLQGYLCNGGDVIDYRWPAAGRFGYRPQHRNIQYLAAQLAWRPDDAALYNNNGEHMNAYRAEFFKHFIRPVILGEPLPDRWRTSSNGQIEPDHTDMIELSSAADTFSNIMDIPNSTGPDLVLIVPGHEIARAWLSTEGLIRDQNGLQVWTWDWTGQSEVRSLNEVARLSPDVLKRSALTLAAMVKHWRSLNPNARLHVLATSSGTMITAVACDLPPATGIPDKAFESLVFTSGLLSTEHTIDGVLRCSRRGLYNYYSSRNKVLIGTQFDCSSTCDANSAECINDMINASVKDAVRWPSVGRFGYRGQDRLGNVQNVYQLGWTSQTGGSRSNTGAHQAELGRSFAEAYFLPIWMNQQSPSEWMHDVSGQYLDIQ